MILMLLSADVYGFYLPFISTIITQLIIIVWEITKLIKLKSNLEKLDMASFLAI
uniref:Uncharacterized protein n=1 Tax=Tetranychus urticae TaxID=32264 RepID=T1JQ18_TETUR